MFRFKRSNAGALAEPFSVGEVVILSSATELALSQVILIPEFKQEQRYINILANSISSFVHQYT